MKDIILITGANGHLARILNKYLTKDYHVRFLTTKKTKKRAHFYWNIKKKYIDQNALKNCKHIIHLAGFPILKRWTHTNKSIMYDSRVKSTDILLQECKLMNIKPKTFICASAIGIYNQDIKEKIYEDSQKGNDWIAKMAIDWENAANQFNEIGSRVIQLRISLIFSELNGFLKYNLLSVKYGIGLIIGNAKRNINWMHVDDISRFIKKCLNNKNYNGAYNMACDEDISQEKILQLIQRNLFPYSMIIKIPNFIVNILLGNRTKIINSNIHIANKRLKKEGFTCEFNSLLDIITKM